MQLQDDYSVAYRSLKLTRDAHPSATSPILPFGARFTTKAFSSSRERAGGSGR
jgi:hypothetical protein